MSKSKWKTFGTIIFMVIIAGIVVMFYFYLSNRTTPFTTSKKEMSEVEKMINLDFDNNYPGTPREVAKVYGGMVKVLHSDIKDDQVKALALKMRGFFDDELLNNNPEDEYLQNLYSEVASDKKNGKKITNVLIVNKSKEKEKTIKGRECAIVYVAYTISKKSKYSETWKYLLRKNDKKQWKILGWKYVPDKK